MVPILANTVLIDVTGPIHEECSTHNGRFYCVNKRYSYKLLKDGIEVLCLERPRDEHRINIAKNREISLIFAESLKEL